MEETDEKKEVHINPLTGTPLDDAHYQAIIQSYGSLENFEKETNKRFGGAKPNHNRGDKQFKDAQKEHQKTQNGLGLMIADGIYDSMHYFNATGSAMDIVDAIRAKDEIERKQNFMYAAGTEAGEWADNYIAQAQEARDYADELVGRIAGGLSTAVKTAGRVEDVKNTVQLAKKMLTTKPRDYESTYFQPSKTQPEQPMYPTDQAQQVQKLGDQEHYIWKPEEEIAYTGTPRSRKREPAEQTAENPWML